MTDLTLEPISFPVQAEGWRDFLEHRLDGSLDEAKGLIEKLKDGTLRTRSEVLELWNDTDMALGRAMSMASVISEVHPDAKIREFAESRVEAGDAVLTARGLDHELWQAVSSATDAGNNDPDADRLYERILRDFSRSGVDQPEDVRAHLTELAEHCTKLGLEFSRNIRDGKREIKVPATALEGLPQDFIDEHPVDADGLVTLTTAYPDAFPVRTFAKDAAVREALTAEFLNVGYPDNTAVLAELLAKRDERAKLLGFPDWPTYFADDKMIGTGAAIAEFIDRLDELTQAPSARDIDQLLALLRRDKPDATGVTPADSLYYAELVKSEQFDVDAQQVRQYFSFPDVRAGLLDVTGRLFGLEYRSVDVPTWHPDVATYDVLDMASQERLGRIYLDLHPRDGKYNHAAQFDVVTGVEGRVLPEGALVCNLPRGLMDHDDVVTLFHEFGHLVHHIVGGHQRWAEFSGVATEWDFVEAPSQLLEEWAWDADVLRTFARNAAGEQIPEDLVAKMRAAEGFGRGAFVRRQANFTALAYRLHAEPYTDIETIEREVDEHFGPYAVIPKTHQYAGFGHLEGYTSAYYTYMWSLVIAKDLFTAFDSSNMLDTERGLRYRRTILEPGGSIDAADLITAFLGRPYAYAAFESWVRGE